MAAVDMFSRSNTSKQLKYTTFISDGDSSSFGRVKEAVQALHGDSYEITKEECVGHGKDSEVHCINTEII